MCPITGDKSFDVVVAVVERASFRIGKVVVQGRGARRIIIPAYVDDMFIATKERGRAQQVIQDLEKHFQVHDLGDVSFLLGVHIQRE